MELTDDGTTLAVSHDGAELFRYVYLPPEAQVESPRPYLHPVRTLGGELVSVYRPDDHVWHKGIAWSLPHVGPANFWGGPTFVRDEGYRQLTNNGAMRHREFGVLSAEHVTHTLDWITEQGERWVTEERTLRVSLVDGGWALGFTSAMRNVRGQPIVFGSPTTEGRPNAGYGGLMWRGPREFAGGTVVLPDRTGGDELMGARAPWLAYQSSATVLFVDGNPGPPTKWFVRTQPFACACPAPFFDQEVTLTDTLTLTYAVVIADGTPDPAALASEVRLGPDGQLL